jgi:hypothetical protein
MGTGWLLIRCIYWLPARCRAGIPSGLIAYIAKAVGAGAGYCLIKDGLYRAGVAGDYDYFRLLLVLEYVILLRSITIELESISPTNEFNYQ